MTLGNLTAIVQNNLKRLLAYSSVAHAGYALMGLSAASAAGAQSVMIYMLVYLVMNLGAFLVVIVVAQATGSESIDDYKGLARRHPLSAIAFAVFWTRRWASHRAAAPRLPNHAGRVFGRAVALRVW